MAILNYTTSISAEKTTAEIQKKLAAHKAKSILCDYDDDAVLCAISFLINTKHGNIYFKMHANTDGVLRTLRTDPKVPKRLKSKEQAARVAWRIRKDWLEAQFAIIDSEQGDIVEMFLPFAQGQDGKTVYQSIKESSFKLLTHEA